MKDKKKKLGGIIMCSQLKFLTADVYTKEIPDELALGFSVIGCPYHCDECHSNHLWNTNVSPNLGDDLTVDNIMDTVNRQSGVSVILFLGGDWELEYLTRLCQQLRNTTGIPLALYSGRDLSFFLNKPIFNMLKYLKTGAYIKELGGLSSNKTNQRLYRITGYTLEDITYKFWRKDVP